MRTNHTITTALAAALVIGGLALPVFGGDVVRGRDLLTPEEWQTHRTEMLKAATPAERQELQQKMQQLIQQRATEQGVTLYHQTGGRMMGYGTGNGPCPGGGRGAGWGGGPGYGWGGGPGR